MPGRGNSGATARFVCLTCGALITGITDTRKHCVMQHFPSAIYCKVCYYVVQYSGSIPRHAAKWHPELQFNALDSTYSTRPGHTGCVPNVVPPFSARAQNGPVTFMPAPPSYTGGLFPGPGHFPVGGQPAAGGAQSQPTAPPAQVAVPPEQPQPPVSHPTPDQVPSDHHYAAVGTAPVLQEAAGYIGQMGHPPPHPLVHRAVSPRPSVFQPGTWRAPGSFPTLQYPPPHAASRFGTPGQKQRQSGTVAAVARPGTPPPPLLHMPAAARTARPHTPPIPRTGTLPPPTHLCTPRPHLDTGNPLLLCSPQEDVPEPGGMQWANTSPGQVQGIAAAAGIGPEVHQTLQTSLQHALERHRSIVVEHQALIDEEERKIEGILQAMDAAAAFQLHTTPPSPGQPDAEA